MQLSKVYHAIMAVKKSSLKTHLPKRSIGKMQKMQKSIRMQCGLPQSNQTNQFAPECGNMSSLQNNEKTHKNLTQPTCSENIQSDV